MNRTKLTIVLFERSRVVTRRSGSVAPVPHPTGPPRTGPAAAARALRRLLLDVAWAVAIAAVALALLGSTSLRPRPSTASAPDAARDRALQRARVRETLALDVHWLAKGASPDDLRQTRESLAFVLRERAGLRLAPDLLERLVAMEARTASGEAGRVSLDGLADAVTRVSIDRLRTLTDDDIRSAAAGFSNARAAGPRMVLSPDDARRVAAGERVAADRLAFVPDPNGAPPPAYVMLRFDGEGLMRANRFVDEAREIRARLGSTREAALVAQAAPRFVREALDERLETLGEAFPDAETSGLTPVQALLLVYSLASDDGFEVPTAELVRAARAETDALDDAALAGLSRDRAFGRGGAYFSTPLDMAFDRRVVTAFLDRLDAEVRR